MLVDKHVLPCPSYGLLACVDCKPLPFVKCQLTNRNRELQMQFIYFPRACSPSVGMQNVIVCGELLTGVAISQASGW